MKKLMLLLSCMLWHATTSPTLINQIPLPGSFGDAAFGGSESMQNTINSINRNRLLQQQAEYERMRAEEERILLRQEEIRQLRIEMMREELKHLKQAKKHRKKKIPQQEDNKIKQ